ncbi:hypothetical protein [Thalassotalea aquiviva]|uniref:hypothetical protein n=1 Tax=Thalassotalea aquiviva TaxID=3242415 RepID=UPI00352A58BD
MTFNKIQQLSEKLETQAKLQDLKSARIKAGVTYALQIIHSRTGSIYQVNRSQLREYITSLLEIGGDCDLDEFFALIKNDLRAMEEV